MDEPIIVKVYMHESTYAALARRADTEGCTLSALCSRLLMDESRGESLQGKDRE